MLGRTAIGLWIRLDNAVRRESVHAPIPLRVQDSESHQSTRLDHYGWKRTSVTACSSPLRGSVDYPWPQDGTHVLSDPNSPSFALLVPARIVPSKRTVTCFAVPSEALPVARS